MLFRIGAFSIFLVVIACNSYGDRVEVVLLEQASTLNDMSPDGRYIVGQSVNGLPYLQDFVDGTFTELAAGPRQAVAVSDDGQTILGSDMPNPDGENGTVAAIWKATAPDTWTSLGYLPDALNCPSKSDGYELSADGSVAVGLSWDGCSGRGFRWTEATGMVELEGLANGGNRASAVSADGNLIAGFAQGSFSRTPVFWDGTTGNGTLLDPPNGDMVGEVYAISDDGSLLLGTQSGEATMWSETDNFSSSELIGAGSFRPSWTGIPTDISNEGTVVGFDLLPGSGIRRGWLKFEDGDIQELNQFVVANGGELPIINNAPLVLEVAQAVSANGRVIAGHGGLFTTPWRLEIYADCDVDSDFDCDIQDIDALVTEIANNASDELFDLNGDGTVDLMDRDIWLSIAGAENLTSGNPYILGDANLDGSVDVSDFNVWNSNKFSASGLWSRADFNADGQTDVSDFNIWNGNKFSSSDAATVPEPNGILIISFGFIGAAACVRHRRHRFA